MSINYRQAGFNIEKELADVRLSPADRLQVLEAARMAEGIVAMFASLGGAIKRVAEMFAPKHSVRT